MGLNNTLSGDRPFVTVGQDGLSQFNGSTGTEIQSAINSLSSVGGTVHIKKGTYSISSRIVITDDITIEGDGKATILQANASLTEEILRNNDTSSGNENITIKNLMIDGNSNIGSHSINLQQCTNFLIENIYIFEPKFSGIYVYNLDGSNLPTTCRGTIRNNHIDGTGGSDNGIKVYGCREIEITGNISNNCSSDGIWVGACYEPIVTNNLCYNNTRNGIWLGEMDTSTFFTQTEQAVCSNNICRGNTVDGIYGYKLERSSIVSNVCFENRNGISFGVGDSRNNTISSNVCYLNQFHGIYINSSDYNVISNNNVYDNSQDTTDTYNGINLSDSDQNIIIGNIISNTSGGAKRQKYGIETTGTTENTFISGNKITNNVTGAISVVDSSYQKFGNTDAEMSAFKILGTLDMNTQQLTNVQGLVVNNNASITSKDSGAAARTVTKLRGDDWLEVGDSNLGASGKGIYLRQAPLGQNDITSSNIPYIITGTAAPAVTPVKKGNIFVDSTNTKVYIATGNSSSADWSVLN